MKKIIVVVMFGILFFTGCGKQNPKNVDYSEYLFTNSSWTRDGGNDIETIRFNGDGSFSYYCSCGNPVNDSDLCDTYTYNEETKEIKFNCFEETEEMITNIKIVEVTEEIFKLDFNGEIREFEKRDVMQNIL